MVLILKIKSKYTLTGLLELTQPNLLILKIKENTWPLFRGKTGHGLINLELFSLHWCFSNFLNAYQSTGDLVKMQILIQEIWDGTWNCVSFFLSLSCCYFFFSLFCHALGMQESSWAGDQTPATVVTWARVMTLPDPPSAVPPGNFWNCISI